VNSVRSYEVLFFKGYERIDQTCRRVSVSRSLKRHKIIVDNVCIREIGVVYKSRSIMQYIRPPFRRAPDGTVSNALMKTR
jgi:hypothetical protein